MLQKYTYTQIKEISEQVYQFLKNNDIQNLVSGRYKIGNNLYANLDTYTTYKRSERNYEIHRRYIDIHIVILGQELIAVQQKDKLIAVGDYDKKMDIAFFASQEIGEDILVDEGECVVFFPGDAHMPALSKDETMPKKVKKMVIKVPLSYTKNIKFLVMDVDGTLTDGKIYLSDSGELCKAFNIKDGCGIHDILIPNGIVPTIITGRQSNIVLNRCREIGITNVHQGISDKLTTLKRLTDDFSTIAYMGDDINDLECMGLVKAAGGLVGCPSDAVKQVLEIADFVADHRAGDGAVRDFIDYIVYR